MTDKKLNFYRIELESTSWCPGQNLQFGHRENVFTRNWRSQEAKPPDPRTCSGEFINLQLMDFYNAVIKPENQSKTLADLPAVTNVLREALEGFNYALLANREFAFELVRRERFPDRPSRMHCIFLVPDSTESVKFWWEELKSQGKSKRRLFRVAGYGTVHRVNQKLLNPLRTCSIREWEAYANAYWSDQASTSVQDEFLFAGNIEILSEINLDEFGLNND
jgi:Protein of unknown function (DUF2441)